MCAKAIAGRALGLAGLPALFVAEPSLLGVAVTALTGSGEEGGLRGKHGFPREGERSEAEYEKGPGCGSGALSLRFASSEAAGARLCGPATLSLPPAEGLANPLQT